MVLSIRNRKSKRKPGSGEEMKFVYISGPMSGVKEFNRPAFEDAAKRLRKAGHLVVSPIEMDDDENTLEVSKIPGDFAWQELLRRDLDAMLGCDSIHLLKGWEHSKGANLEVFVAKELGFTFVNLEGFEIEPPVVSLGIKGS